MFSTKNIKEDFPKWEDRVKYLFKLTPDNKVTRNQEIDPAYFKNSHQYGRYLNHKTKIYEYITVEFSKEVFKTETPPRAWGRLSHRHALSARLRNTPTGVGKTYKSAGRAYA